MLLEFWAKTMMFLCHFDAGLSMLMLLNNDIYYEL